MPIYDQSYRRIEGIRAASRFRFLPIAQTGVRLFFRRRLYVLLGFAALVPFFAMLLFICGPHLMALDQHLPQQAAAVLHVTGTGIFLYLVQWEWIFLFLFAAFAGSGLIANDLRANALEIYFSRPITVLDYFLGKLFVVLTILLGLTLGPMLVLWVVDVALTDQPGFWRDQLHFIPRMAAASLLMSVPYAMMILAVSALVKTARNAIVVFAALERMSSLVGTILLHALDDSRYGLISIDRCIQRLLSAVLEPDQKLLSLFRFGNDTMPLADLSPILPACTLGVVLVLCLIVIFKRVRAVEIVAS